jgi:TorA maturation chaperone TorD
MDRTIERMCDEELCLARAVLWRLAALAFRHPAGSWRDEWSEALRGAGAALETLGDEARQRGPAGARTMAELCQACDRLPAAALDDDRLRSAHLRLFGPTPRSGVTPYESEWIGAPGELSQFHRIADVSGFYRAFGLDLAATCDERHDHLSVELAFLNVLAVKEAYALARGLDDMAQTCRSATRRFLAEHLGRWAPACCARLVRADPTGFHGLAARFLAELVRLEGERVGASPGDVELRPIETSTALEDCCVSCDKLDACAGATGRRATSAP